MLAWFFVLTLAFTMALIFAGTILAGAMVARSARWVHTMTSKTPEQMGRWLASWLKEQPSVFIVVAVQTFNQELVETIRSRAKTEGAESAETLRKMREAKAGVWD